VEGGICPIATLYA